MRSDPTYPLARPRPDPEPYGYPGTVATIATESAEPIRLGAPGARASDQADDAPPSAYRPPLYQPLRGGGALSLTRSPIIAGRAGTTVLSRRSIVLGLPDSTPVPMRTTKRRAPVTPTALPGANLAKLVPVQFTPTRDSDHQDSLGELRPAPQPVIGRWFVEERLSAGSRDWTPPLQTTVNEAGPALAASTTDRPRAADRPAAGRRLARTRVRSTGRGRRVLLVGAAGLAAVFGAAYAAALVYAGMNVPRGTRVLGVPIGGMTGPAAERKLNATFGPRAAAPITVRVGERAFVVRPEAAGLGFDPHATARDAARRSYDPLVVLPALFRHDRPVPPRVTVDAVRLDGALAGIGRQTDVKLREGAVTFERGHPQPVYPRAGSALDINSAAAKLANAFPVADDLSLPVRERFPHVSTSAVDAAVSGFGAQAMSGPLTLALDGVTTTLSPATIGRTLHMTPTSTGTLEPHVDTAVLLGLVAGRFGAVDSPARNASFTVVHGKVVLTPSRDGRSIDPLGVSTGVIAALGRRDDRVANLALARREPELRTADARALGIRDVIGSYTGTFSAGPAVSGNIRRASRLIAGSVLMPGQSWSFNQRVGQRGPANGFAAGVSVTDGHASPDFGAGTGEVATAVFNAAFQAGLADVRHTARTSYSDDYPMGRDAVVGWPDADLVFRNDSGHPVYLDADVTGHSVTISVLGVRWYLSNRISTSARHAFVAAGARRLDGRSCVARPATPGFEVDVTRTLIRSPGAVPERTIVHTRYAPQDRISCGASAGSAPPARAKEHPRKTGSPAGANQQPTN